MLDFAGQANDGSLAVAFNCLGIPTQRSDQSARHFESQRLIVHETGNLFHVRTRERIPDDRQHGRATRWHGRRRASLVEDFLHDGDLLANLDLRP